MPKILTATAILAALALASAATAQRLDLKLDALAARASEHNIVDLNSSQLRALSGMAAQKKSAQSEKLQKALEGVDSVRVWNFEFAGPGQYGDAELAPIRQQLHSPGWSCVISSREKHETTEIYVMTISGKMAGLAILAAEPKELTVVNIAGAVPLADLQELVSSSIKFDLSKLKENPALKPAP